MITDEGQTRLELQMALDSKDSDIEQLRCQITSLSIHSLDSTSISSGNDLDADEAYPGNPGGPLVRRITLNKTLFLFPHLILS